jgi:hypothetical protein
VPLTPPDGGTGINNVSVVFLGQIGQRRVLLMGDVEDGIDPSLLADGLPHVDLLKVAHHGSKTATTQAFVDATRPSVAVASAGAGNPYGHPAKATLDRLAAAGARVLRTDRDGTVVVGFEPDRMTVRTEGATPAASTTGSDPATATLASARSDVSGLAPAFLCAIPVTALVPSVPPRSPRSPSRVASSRIDRAASTQSADLHLPAGLPVSVPVLARRSRRPLRGARRRRAEQPRRPTGRRHGLGYHRIDDRPARFFLG